MAKKIAGTCYIKVDGEQLELEGSLELPVSNTTREAVMSLGGVAGFKEVARAPRLAGDFIFTGAFPLEKITTATDMVITAELANDMIYTLTGAFFVGDSNITADEGKIPLEFNGEKGYFNA